MRAADGRGGGKCRGEWEKRREVGLGLERWIGGRIGGIGLIGWVHAGRSVNQSINQPINQSTNQSINQSINQFINFWT